jgi:acetyltransferase-like isoleucine patch superfamily enzyme
MIPRFWNQRPAGLPGAAYEILAAGWNAARDRLSTLLRRGNFARAGRHLRIQSGVRIRNPSRVSLGDRIRIGRNVLLTTERPEGRLDIGDDTWIDRGCHIDFTGDLSIGRRCTLSADVRLYSHDHGRDPRSRPNGRSLRIGDDVWLGTGVSVLQNAGELGDGCVVAAGAVVTKPVPAGMLAGGNPARLIGPVDKKPAEGDPTAS